MTGIQSWKNGDIYEDHVINFLQRRGFSIENDLERVGKNSHNQHDIYVKSFRLKIEVKGSELSRKDESDGSFAFNKDERKDAYIFAFVFGSEGFTLFLTKKEVLDLKGRKRKKQSKRIKLIDVFDKALNNRNIFNF